MRLATQGHHQHKQAGASMMFRCVVHAKAGIAEEQGKLIVGQGQWVCVYTCVCVTSHWYSAHSTHSELRQ